MKQAKRPGRAAAALLALVVVFGARAAVAEEAEPGPSPTGLRLGLRTGFARPLGLAFNGSGALTDTIHGYVPLRFDVGLRLFDHFYVGALVQHAVVLPDACVGDLSCTGRDTRIGVLAAFHLRPRKLVDPWVGFGFGYEILSSKRSTSSTKLELHAKGIELFDAELGVDFRPSRGLRVGPVVSTCIGQYTTIELNGRNTSDFNTTVHGWVMFALRGAYDL